MEFRTFFGISRRARGKNVLRKIFVADPCGLTLTGLFGPEGWVLQSLLLLIIIDGCSKQMLRLDEKRSLIATPQT